MKYTPGRATLAVLVAATLMGLTACRNDALDSAPASNPAAATTTSATTTAPATLSLASTPAGSAPAGPAGALAQVSADLSGVEAGISQAATDLGAGDSARTQPDDPN